MPLPVEIGWKSSWRDIARNLREQEDGTKDKWHRAAGEREILVGASSRDIRWKTVITVEWDIVKILIIYIKYCGIYN